MVTAPARADLAPLDEALSPKVMGDPEAPVTLTEFASLSCPHCANFHNNFLPEIKESLIDTGKVRLVYQDFPLDGLALAGSMLARCAGNDRYFGFIEVLFRSQETWTQSSDPREALMGVARLGGMSSADFDACLADQDLLKGVQDARSEASEEHGIRSTPTFMVDGEKLDIGEFGDVIEALNDAVAAN